MKLVVLGRNSVGIDIDVSYFEQFGEVTYYANTATEQMFKFNIIISNKALMNEHTLAGAPNFKNALAFLLWGAG